MTITEIIRAIKPFVLRWVETSGVAGYLKLDASNDPLTGDLSMGDNRITDVSDPTNQQDAATKLYVDTAVAAATWEFFLSDNASDVGGYYTLFPEETTEAASSLTSSALGVGNDQLLWSFATQPGLPNLEFLSLGIFTATFFAQVSGNKTARIYWRLYKRTSGGAETLLMTSGESDELTASLSQFILSSAVTNDIDVDATDRLVLRVYANVTGVGSNVTITIWMEGDYNSRIALRVAASAFSNRFVDQDGDTMTGDLTVPTLTATTSVQGPNVTSGTDPGHSHTHSSISSVPAHDHGGDAGDGGQFAGLSALTDLSSNPGASEKILKSNSSGELTLAGLTLTGPGTATSFTKHSGMGAWSASETKTIVTDLGDGLYLVTAQGDAGWELVAWVRVKSGSGVVLATSIGNNLAVDFSGDDLRLQNTSGASSQTIRWGVTCFQHPV